ncbi:MAG: 30S ribosomal protein S6 [Planctomycetota bacterium]|nr:MAG: 30S ribosomal protein S6 [Planctomycetota bacterium]
MNQYEAMFLFDPTFAGSFENCEGEIRRLMERAEAEILFCRKWDERRLAYPIRGRKRGVYVLVYFKAAPDRIAGLERDARLSEHILRVLVLRADHVTPEDMERFCPSAREPADRGEKGSSEPVKSTPTEEAETPTAQAPGEEAPSASSEGEASAVTAETAVEGAAEASPASGDPVE